MTYRTRQEIFDIAYLGLEGQGFERSTNDAGFCMYRSPDKRKCGIGHLIDDNDYRPIFEGQSVLSDDDIVKAAKISTKSTADFTFANNIQGIHDNSVSPQDMKSRLITFAQEFGLKVPG